MLFIEPVTLVSSAKVVTRKCLTFPSISFIRVRNRKGPRTDPWGTPFITSDSSDLVPFTTTCGVLPVRCKILPKIFAKIIV